MARANRLAVLAVTVVVLGGCGGSGTTPGASAATTQPSSVVTTPALTLTPAATASSSPDLAALASQYTALADKGNAAVAECDKDKAAAVSSLAKSKVAAQGCLTTYIGYVADLKAISWGPVQPQADKVIGDMDDIDALIVQMINAPDASTFRAEYDQLTPLGVTLLADANAMRAALGLPPAP